MRGASVLHRAPLTAGNQASKTATVTGRHLECSEPAAGTACGMREREWIEPVVSQNWMFGASARNAQVPASVRRRRLRVRMGGWSLLELAGGLVS